MSNNKKDLTRREFIELAAAGAAGTMALTLGGPSIIQAAPKRGGTLTCGMPFLIQTPDPQRRTGTWARQSSALCWEGLCDPISLGERAKIIAEKGPDAIPEVKPMLADAWDIEKGGTRYVFHLKKGVKFHDGKELDSGDVAWGWKRIQDPVHQSSTRKLTTTYLKSVETPDKYTAVANLTRPYAAFLIANAWINTVILPKDCIPKGKIFGQSADFKPDRTAPPGTGPFEMVEFQQKQRAVFKAFKDYRVPGLPYLDKIIYRVISKAQPRTMALRAGNIDYAHEMNRGYLMKMMKGQKLYEPFKKEGLEFYARLQNNIGTLYLNSHPTKGNSPFKDERVRKALDLCIDRPLLNKTLFKGLGSPVAQGFHPTESIWGFDDIKPPETNIEKAKQLLKEAGYPNGLDVEFKINPTAAGIDQVAQVIQQMTRPAGFRVKIALLAGRQFFGSIRTNKFHMVAATLGKEDPIQFYYHYLHTDPVKPYNGFSPLGLKDPVMDKLLDDMAGETDVAKRRKVFKEVVLRSNEKVYWIPIVAFIAANGWSTKVQNFRPWDYFWPEQAFREAWV